MAKLKLDLGCGESVREGFAGADIRSCGQKYVCDLKEKWPWKDKSVEEVYSRNFVPCLKREEWPHFFNELYRVLDDGGKASLVIPSWSSSGGYGHPHYQSVVMEGFFYFLNKDWREQNAKDVKEYACDFDATWGYGMHPNLTVRNQEYQQFAMSNYINAAIEMIVSLTKRV